MLVEQSLEENLDVSTLDLAGTEALYQRANTHLKESEEFAQQALTGWWRCSPAIPRPADWQQLIDVSLAGFNQTYQRMNILLTDADIAGESIYNDDLPVVAADSPIAASRWWTTAPGRLRGRLEAPAMIRNSRAATATTARTWPPSGTGSVTCAPTA